MSTSENSNGSNGKKISLAQIAGMVDAGKKLKAGDPSAIEAMLDNKDSAPQVVQEPEEDKEYDYWLAGQLHEMAKNVAQREGTREGSPETLAALEHEALRVIPQAMCTPFDLSDPADSMANDEYQVQLTRRERQEQRVENATVTLDEKKGKRSRIGDVDRPSVPWLIALAGAIAVGISMALSFHDIVFVHICETSLQAMVLSIASGFVVGFVFIAPLVRSAAHPGKKHRWQAPGFVVAAIAVGVALYLIRLSAVTTDRENYLALGFAVLETASVLVVELFCLSYRASMQQYHAWLERALVADREVEAAEHALQRDLEKRAEVEALLEKHLQRVARRQRNYRLAEQIKDSAKASVQAGYEEGLALNRGRLAGVTRPEPEA